MNVLGWINRFVMIVLALMIVVDASMVAALKIIQIRLNALEPVINLVPLFAK
ncbi:MAG: hypothetical protein P4L50_30380 [Anaerolineaceae bacterium]|nr:hypothetical protein [Anaerolineaceae bacterium]